MFRVSTRRERRPYILLDDDEELSEHVSVISSIPEPASNQALPSTTEASQLNNGIDMAYPVFKDALLQSMNANLNLRPVDSSISPRTCIGSFGMVCPIPKPVIVSSNRAPPEIRAEVEEIRRMRNTNSNLKKQQPCLKEAATDTQSWTEDETSLEGTESECTTKANHLPRGVVFADEIGGQPLTTVYYYPSAGATYHSHPTYERVIL